MDRYLCAIKSEERKLGILNDRKNALIDTNRKKQQVIDKCDADEKSLLGQQEDNLSRKDYLENKKSYLKEFFKSSLKFGLKSSLWFLVGIVLISLLGKAYEPIAIFNVEYIDYKLNKVSLKRYLEYLDLKDVKNMYEGKLIKHLNGKVTLKNVSFSYGEKPVLRNINLDIKENSKVAFVGETGSGKSTVIKLISGLISPQDGIVEIDGKDLLKLQLDSYYDHLSYLSQDSPIFDGTLKENIVFDKEIADEKIIEVLKLVELEKFYSKLKNGLQTELGEKGILISGGERQRIALARLFFDDSKIIILDEATSAMDNITEEKVMKVITEKLSNKTFIIIAHRLNTIKNVDEIFVLRNGEILSSGTYEYLQTKCEYFKELSLKKK